MATFSEQTECFVSKPKKSIVINLRNNFGCGIDVDGIPLDIESERKKLIECIDYAVDIILGIKSSNVPVEFRSLSKTVDLMPLSEAEKISYPQ